MNWCGFRAVISKCSTIITFSRSLHRPPVQALGKFLNGKVTSCWTITDRPFSAEVDPPKNMRVLNVAEKNDAAKSIADLMSRGGYQRREGISRFNKIYEYDYHILGQNCKMTMTSVSGHLLNYEFVGQYKKWRSVNPVALFDAPVQKFCPDDYVDIKRTLEREIRGCSTLIIWTDCDREGENIGFEIVEVCKAVKPNIRILRAKFSEITPQAIDRACRNLAPPDQRINDAVDVRTELDLRIGAAFTRFQTMRLQKVFPNVLGDQLVSYGSCQFPTLGFVVERYKQVEAFIPEPFWKIRVSHQVDEGMAEFNWKRVRLFDHTAVLAIYMHCLETPMATVVDVRSKSKSKWRPAALDTVELEKLASRKLKINAKETMKIAEKLYTSGFISYPRTETNIFPNEFDLPGLVQKQTQDPNWGGFAAQVLQQGPNPRNGKKTDQAHPPIHPTKYTNTLQGNEARVYEFIVRHFLACLSEDAQGMETTIEIDIAEEKFTVSGLMIIARNYLEVYPYERWNAKIIPVMQTGQQFMPTAIEMNEGETSPPALLTEADLISLMDKHGIGTDATHADHIETIKSRVYVGLQNDGRFVPGELGIGLVNGYDNMGYQMSKPNLRSELEADLKLICDGRKNRDVVLQEQIRKYREVFVAALSQANKLDEALSEYFGEAQVVSNAEVQPQVSMPVMPCPGCGQNMVLKTKKDNKGFFVTCMGFPDCKTAIWFPDGVTAAEVTDHVCETCQPGPVHKLRLKFKRGAVIPSIPRDCVSCIAGCDPDFAEFFRLSRPAAGQAPAQRNQTRPNAGNRRNNDSGYGSSFNSSNSNTGGSQNNTHSFRSQNNNLGRQNPRPTNNQGGQQNNTQFPAPRPPTNTNSNSYHTSANNGFGSNVNRGGGAANQGFGSNNNNRGGSLNSGFGSNTNNRGGSTSLPGFGNNNRGSVSNTGGRLPFSSVAVNNNNAGYSDGESNAIVCSCGDDARKLTVRKDGPNQGREFYGCAKPQGASCGFFLWGDEGNQAPDNQKNGYGGNSGTAVRTNTGYQPQIPAGSTNGGEGKCKCGLDATSRTVQKDGPNKGRQFLCCVKPREDQCGYFEWADQTGGGDFGENNPPDMSRGRGRGVGSGGTKRKSSTTPQPGTKRRKCGACGEEGHTRTTCKSKNQYD